MTNLNVAVLTLGQGHPRQCHSGIDVHTISFADGYDPAIAVSIIFGARDGRAGYVFFECSCGLDTAQPGDTFTLAQLINFGRVNSVEPDALVCDLNSIPINNASSTKGSTYNDRWS